MGTNYYLHAPACPHCGHEAEKPIHLGKSSGGWCYGLHVMPEIGIHTLQDVGALITDKINDGWEIKNEYGDKLSKGQWAKIVLERRGRNFRKDKEWYVQNSATRGPNGLVRHIVDGWHCIGHGEGTYDYIIGEFS